jgi:hypothetical protein
MGNPAIVGAIGVVLMLTSVIILARVRYRGKRPDTYYVDAERWSNIDWDKSIEQEADNDLQH